MLRGAIEIVLYGSAAVIALGGAFGVVVAVVAVIHGLVSPVAPEQPVRRRGHLRVIK